MAKCSQCGKLAALKYDDLNLCVEHYLMMEQAKYLQLSMMAAYQNMLADELDAGAGYLIRHARIQIPRPPFIGNKLTLNNINISGSTVGSINFGTIKNLDASITVMQSHGEKELAAAITELTQAVVDSKELDDVNRKEIAEQLEFLVAQATAEPQNRSTGLVKSILAGIRDPISVSAGLLAIWDKVEPLFHAAFGI